MDNELLILRQIATPKKRAILAAYCVTANITLAAKAAGIHRCCHYNWMQSDEQYVEAFARCKEIAADTLESEAIRRAKDGVERLKFHQGVLIHVPARDADGNQMFDDDGEPMLVPYVEHEYSDVLLIFLLKGLMPEKYRERYEHTMTKKSDEHLDVYGKTKKQLRAEAAQRIEVIRQRLGFEPDSLN